MSLAQPLHAYMDAYVQKEVLLSDPLLEEGVITAEQEKLIGTITIEMVESFDDTEQVVSEELPAKIAECEQIMDANKAAVLDFFTKGTDAVIFNKQGKVMSVEDGEIIIDNAI